MENNKPLLSICIPTYNREKYLPECLDSIISQDGFSDGDIEIIISDNASIDNTENIVKKYQDKYNNIRYHKNEENIGAILNVLNIINIAKGKYCWIISDDDAIEDNSNLIKELIKNIKENDFDQMIVNFKVYNKSLDEIIDNNPLKFIKNDIKFNNNKDFLDWIIKNDKYSSMLLFISIRIFKKSFWLQNTKLIEKFIINPEINLHPHSSILINNIEEQRVAILSNAFIKARSNNFCWDDSGVNGYKLTIKLYKFLFLNITYWKFKLYLIKGIIIDFKIIFIFNIVLLTKKIGLYKILSPLYRKYILKIK